MRTLELGPTPLPRALSGRSSATLAPAVTGERAKSLVGQLQLECEAMARHALQHGLAVPAELIAQLSALIDSADGADVDATMAAAPRRSPETPGARARELAAMHRKLAHAVAPATPQGITLLDTERRRGQRFAWLGPVPLIRVLTVASVLFLLAVVGTGLPAEVSSANMQRGFLASSGSTLLWNTLFLLFCAGLGASFATLFHAHRYVANSTYDPKFDASYGARLILGVIAGLILVEMLPADLFRSGPMNSFGKPSLAMLGGFSATAVHRLLQRLVDTVETLVRGDGSSQVSATLDAQRAHAATERIQSQSDLAARLLELQQALDAGTTPVEIRQRLGDFTRAMLSPESAPSASTAVDGAASTGQE